MDKKKRKQPSPVSFYLGKEETPRRKISLDNLAHELGFEDRSKLLQAIADRAVEVRQKQAS